MYFKNCNKLNLLFWTLTRLKIVRNHCDNQIRKVSFSTIYPLISNCNFVIKNQNKCIDKYLKSISKLSHAIRCHDHIISYYDHIISYHDHIISWSYHISITQHFTSSCSNTIFYRETGPSFWAFVSSSSFWGRFHQYSLIGGWGLVDNKIFYFY